jgi:hypothetical protein
MSYEFKSKKVTIDIDLELLKYSSNAYYSFIKNHLTFIKDLKKDYNSKNSLKNFFIVIFFIYLIFSLVQVSSTYNPLYFTLLIPLLLPFFFIKKIKTFNSNLQKLLNDLENTKLYLNYSNTLEWDNVLKYTKSMNGVSRVKSFNQIFFNQDIIKLNQKNYLLPRSLISLGNETISIITSKSLLSKLKISHQIFKKTFSSSALYKFSEFDHSHWLHQRKDGGPDNRYRENYVIEYRKAHMLYIDSLAINIEYSYIYDVLIKNYTLSISNEKRLFHLDVDGVKMLSNNELAELVNSPVINNSASVNINEQGNSSLLPASEKVSNIKGDILTETSKDNHLTIKETFEVVDENSKTIDTLSTQATVSLSNLITFDYSKKFESPGSNRYSSEFKNFIVYQIVSGTPLKNLTKKESLDEKTTRGWLYTLLENFNFDPYQRDTWFNNDELIKTIKNEGITIFNKDKVSKKRNPFSLNVEELNLSKESLTQLKLSGIDKLEHFDAFTLKELRMLLTNTFEEITSVLKQYALPRTLENLNFSKDIIDILKSNAITDLKDLLASDPESIVEMFKFDTVLNAKVIEVLSFYTSEPNTKENTQNVSRTLPSTKLPNDIKKTLLTSESKAYDFHSNKDININISTSTIKDVIDLIWNRNHSISKFITGDTPSISLVSNSKNSLIKRYISPLEQQYIILYSIKKSDYEVKYFKGQKMLTYKINEPIDYGQTVKISNKTSSDIGIVVGKSNVLNIPYYYDDAVEVFGKHNDYLKLYDIRYIFEDVINKIINQKTIYTNMELLYLSIIVNELSYDLFTHQTHYLNSMILTALKVLYNQIKNHQFQKDYFFTDINLSKGITIIKDFMLQGQIEEFLKDYQNNWLDFLSVAKIEKFSSELDTVLRTHAFANGILNYSSKNHFIESTDESINSYSKSNLSSIPYSVKTNLEKLEAYCFEHTDPETKSVKHNPDFGSLTKNKKVYSNSVTTFIFKTVLEQYKNLIALKKEIYLDTSNNSLDAKDKRLNYLKITKDFEKLIINFFSFFNKDDAFQFIRTLLTYALNNNINKTNKFYALQPLLMVSNISVLDIVGTHSTSYALNGKGYPDFFRKSMNDITGLNNIWIGITNIALRDEKGAIEVSKQIISNPLFLKARMNSFDDYLENLNHDSYDNDFILNYRGNNLFRPRIKIDYNNNDFKIIESSFLKNQPLDKATFSKALKLNGLVFTEKIGSQIKNFINLDNKLYDIEGNEVTLNNIDIFIANTTYMSEHFYIWEMIATAHTGYFINNILLGDTFNKTYPKLKQKVSVYTQTQFIDKSQLEELKAIKKEVVVENKKGIATTLDLGERQLTPVIIDDKLAFIDQTQKIFKSFPKQIKTDNANKYSFALDEVERIKSLVAGIKKETQDFLKLSFRNHKKIPLVKYKEFFGKRMSSAFADNWLYVSVKGDTSTVFYHDEDLTPRNINDEVIDINENHIYTAHPYYYYNDLDTWIKLFADYDRTIEKLQLSTKYYNVLDLMDDKGIITKFNGLSLSSNKVYFGLIQPSIFYFEDDETWGVDMHSLVNQDMFVEVEAFGSEIKEIKINEFDHNDIEKLINLSNQLHLVISATE